MIVRCDRCPRTIDAGGATLDARVASLRVRGWLDCPRRGGKLSGLCPECRPKVQPQTMGAVSKPSDE